MSQVLSNSHQPTGLKRTLESTAAAMSAQAKRKELIAQNITHANIPAEKGKDPYRRQLAVFQDVLNGFDQPTVQMVGIKQDQSEPLRIHDPTHYVADAEGMVSYPNVNSIMEMQDLFQANQSTAAYNQLMASAVEMERIHLRLLDV